MTRKSKKWWLLEGEPEPQRGLRQKWKRRLIVSLFGLVLLTNATLPASATETSSGISVTETATVEPNFDWPMFSQEDLPNYPCFNAVSDGEYGDESEFLSMVDETGESYRGENAPLVEPGDICTFYVLYHNCGKSDGVRTKAFAQNTHVNVVVNEVADGVEMVATVSADNATPQSVSSALYLQATEVISLEYVNGSAILLNNDKTNRSYLVENELFSSGRGMMIGTNSLSGIVLNGEEHAGYVVFEMKVVAKNESLAEEPKLTTSTTKQELVPSATVASTSTTASVSASKDTDADKNGEFYLLVIVGGVMLVVLATAVASALVSWASNLEQEDDSDEG